MPISAVLVVAAELVTLPATLARAARPTSLAEVIQAASESAQSPSGGASH